ncbi:hypothetical protein [Microvirga sp. VF16]|uniref:hypothetical protein n=1 Tax=Microvirga sp. VF16 TaxID=2807101 RepID=UPI00193EC16C|nr:hypothetical protein [Microvirga sp. VF16]QRM31523.1 hypothetical protein JO965_11350 [Microvirga sp. VF16]
MVVGSIIAASDKAMKLRNVSGKMGSQNKNAALEARPERRLNDSHHHARAERAVIRRRKSGLIIMASL